MRMARDLLRSGATGASGDGSAGGTAADPQSTNSLHRAYESVSSARQSFDVARSACGVSQHLANSRHGVVQAVVEVDKGFSRPDLGPKFLTGYQLAGTIQQCCQHLDRLALQAQLDAAFSQLGSSNIELKIIKPQKTRGWSRCQHPNSPNKATKATTFIGP